MLSLSKYFSPPTFEITKHEGDGGGWGVGQLTSALKAAAFGSLSKHADKLMQDLAYGLSAKGAPRT